MFVSPHSAIGCHYSLLESNTGCAHHAPELVDNKFQAAERTRFTKLQWRAIERDSATGGLMRVLSCAKGPEGKNRGLGDSTGLLPDERIGSLTQLQ
jgi:hypothetical protein